TRIIGKVALPAGQTSVSFTANLGAGSHDITAIYNGDTNYQSAYSNDISEVVTPTTPPAHTGHGRWWRFGRWWWGELKSSHSLTPDHLRLSFPCRLQTAKWTRHVPADSSQLVRVASPRARVERPGNGKCYTYSFSPARVSISMVANTRRG